MRKQPDTDAAELSRMAVRSVQEIMSPTVDIVARGEALNLWDETDADLFLDLERTAFRLCLVVARSRERLLSGMTAVGGFSGPMLTRLVRAVVEGTQDEPEKASDSNPDFLALVQNLRSYLEAEEEFILQDDGRWHAGEARSFVLAVWLGFVCREIVEDSGFQGLLLAQQAAGDACHIHATNLAKDLGEAHEA